MKSALWFAATLLFCTAATAAVPSSINNDDSCDIKVGPAATLLLPYFEVDVNGTSGRTTLFTITNVSRYPQIAHVTLWSDWSYPLLTFNLFFTGYDIQAINLADVLIRGTIATPSGTTPSTPGSFSSTSDGNLRTPIDCGGSPAVLPASITAELRRALTLGIYTPPGRTCSTAGDNHANASGYATIDVVAGCTNRTPEDPLYYTSDLLFDNVLIGDYQQIGASPADTFSSALDASGNPMVHIRAVPEGGGAGSIAGTALPYTFYDRFTPSATRTIDRRQPLPSVFAARYIQGGPAAFATNLTIWREGVTGPGVSCAAHANNGFVLLGELIRFDEHENATSFYCQPTESPVCSTAPFTRSLASSSSSASTYYPPLFGTDVGGWLYLNLDNGGSQAYSVTHDVDGVPVATNKVARTGQNWVTVTMFGNSASGRMTAELDATSIFNGCSPAVINSRDYYRSGPIPPIDNVFVCPPGTTLTNGTTALCTGTNVNPKP